jgi:hypothetical protein
MVSFGRALRAPSAESPLRACAWSESGKGALSALPGRIRRSDPLSAHFDRAPAADRPVTLRQERCTQRRRGLFRSTHRLDMDALPRDTPSVVCDHPRDHERFSATGGGIPAPSDVAIRPLVSHLCGRTNSPHSTPGRHRMTYACPSCLGPTDVRRPRQDGRCADCRPAQQQTASKPTDGYYDALARELVETGAASPRVLGLRADPNHTRRSA